MTAPLKALYRGKIGMIIKWGYLWIF